MEEDRYRSIGRFVATSLFGAGLVFMALGWNEIADPPSLRPEANAVEQVIAVRPVAISLRVALISLAAYVLASVAALVLEGRWLVKAGPAGAEVEPSPALESLRASNAGLDERMTIVEEMLDRLWESVEDVQDDLDQDEEPRMSAMSKSGRSRNSERVRANIRRGRALLERSKAHREATRRALEDASREIERMKRAARAR